jgi:hypothetical protein
MPSPFPGMDPYLEAQLWLSVDYGQPSDPPLAGDDAVWADALLRKGGLR